MSRRHRILPSVALLLALALADASAAYGQVPEAEEKARALAKLGSKAATPGDAGQPRLGVEAILNASSDASKVTVHVGAQAAPAWIVDATVSSPVSKPGTGTNAIAFSDQPLASGATVTFGASFSHFEPTIDPLAVSAVCERVTALNVGRCSTTNPKMSDADRQALRNAVDVGSAYTIGTRFSIGRQDFKYRSGAAGNEVTDSHFTPLSGMLTFGILPLPRFFIGAQAGVENTWKGADAVGRCSALADEPDLSTCENVALKAPTHAQGAVVIFETRGFFSKWAVAPHFEYHSSTQLTLAEIPIYFLSDQDKGGWTGGVVFRETNGNSSVAVFVGSALPYLGFK